MPSLRRAPEAGLLERLLGDLLRDVDLLLVDRLLQAAEIRFAEIALAKMLLKPRLGRRMYSGIWPPSKP